MRNLKDYILLYFKGMAMGAADVVPGVSGGTIAFIVGIYEELVSTISNINPSLLKDLKNKGFASVWKKINGNFLVVLVAGILTSVLTLAKLLVFLMQFYPIQLWAFFFGLILASIWYVGKEVKSWNVSAILGFVLGAIFMIWISVTPPLDPNTSLLFLFFAGALAACAMILPGISGSFILLLLGAYTTVMAGINNRDFALMVVVGLGIITGLLTFSKLLNYLLKNYHNTLIAVLSGFLFGSLWKIWPWKKDVNVFVEDKGIIPFSELSNSFQSLTAYLPTISAEKAHEIKSYLEVNVLPSTYEQINSGVSSQLMYALIFCLIGFSLIFVIEIIAKKKNV